MSNELRIALVSEGKTDRIIIEELIVSILGHENFVLSSLQPELSESLMPLNNKEGGWSGVYKWCEQSKRDFKGRISNNILFDNHDILIVHLDADVAGKTYSSANIKDRTNDLPCEKPCPPAQATVKALERVLLRWMGESALPDKIVFCIPSKSIETWCLTALFPNEPVVLNGNIECRNNPEDVLSGKPVKKRLISSGKKIISMYEKYSPDVASNFDYLKRICSQANKFYNDLNNCLSTMG